MKLEHPLIGIVIRKCVFLNVDIKRHCCLFCCCCFFVCLCVVVVLLFLLLLFFCFFCFVLFCFFLGGGGPSHTGIGGNEKADSTAKSALELPHAKVGVP